MEKEFKVLENIFNVCDDFDRMFPLQYVRCLLLVRKLEGLTISELSENSGLALSTVSRIVNALAEKRQKGTAYNLISVTFSMNNKRSKHLFLTQEGRIFLKNLCSAI